MSEYIDRDAFLTQERAWYCENCDMRKNSKEKMVYEIGEAPCRACYVNDLLNEVENCPAADVVELKTGQWLIYDSDANVYECSFCHELFILNEGTPRENNFNYCPFCGAKMEETNDH